MNRRIVGLLVVGAIMSGDVLSAESRVHIIPKPTRLTVGEGAFTVRAETPVVCPRGDETAEAAARYLCDCLNPPTGFTLQPRSGGAPDLAIFLESGGDATALGKEGYELRVTPSSVRISAATGAGLFYGIQTLRQLMPADVMRRTAVAGLAWQVPAVTIQDVPRFAWRGMLLDVARHFFPVEDVKRHVDLMAFYKLNTLQLHLTDDQGWRIEIKRYPRLTEIGSVRSESPKPGNRNAGDGTPYGPFFYTQDELRDLVAYAASRHITVVPEIELPGHARAALAAYPELGCTGGPYEVRTKWGVEPDIYCAGKDETFTFLENVLSEVLDIFPSTFIHIGGDEAPKQRWHACPRCQARIKAEGLHDEHELQSYFVRRIESFLNGKGRRLIGWDEILEGGLAPNATVMSWRGVKGGIVAARSGHDVVMTPTSHLYFDYYQSLDKAKEPEAIGGFVPLEKVYSYEPLPAELTPAEARHILGAQANVWTEYIRDYAQVQYMSAPRMLALAEVVWSPPVGRAFDEFRARLARHVPHLDAAGVNYRRLDDKP